MRGLLSLVANVVVAGLVLPTVVVAMGALLHSQDGDFAVLRKRLHKKQLVAVPPDHWLMIPLCQAKRLEHEAALRQLKTRRAVKSRGNTGADLSTEKLKNELLAPLLPDLKHEILRKRNAIKAMSERVVLLASAYSELTPEHEPLLVEVALTHCLHEWISHSHRGERSVDDAKSFESFFKVELKGKGAVDWFGLQLLIDTVDVLELSCLFYKEQITNPALRDLIAMSIMESHGESDDNRVRELEGPIREVGAAEGGRGNDVFVATMLIRLAMDENKAAADAWTAWLGVNIATVGSVRRSNNEPTNLTVLGDFVVNPTDFHPDKRAYFPMGMRFDGIVSSSYGDLSGVINREELTSDDDAMRPGFIYQGGDSLRTDTATNEKLASLSGKISAIVNR